MAAPKKEDLVKKLNEAGINCDMDTDYSVLRDLEKELPKTTQNVKQEVQKSPTPVVYNTEDAGMSDYEKRVEDTGKEVLKGKEKEEALSEEIEKLKAQLNLVMQQMANTPKNQQQQIKENEKKFVESASSDQQNTLAILQKEAKINMMIPRRRNPFDKNNISIEKKRQRQNPDGSFVMGANGPIIDDCITVEINDIPFTFNLGPDNGTDVVQIPNVPWSAAKILARKFKIQITNPDTGEIFTPPLLRKPAQNKIIDGMIVQSNQAAGYSM